MPSVFLVSDTHFGHTGVCRFTRDDGTKLRPWDDPDEMDEAMVKAWNERVKPLDKVYHLGDVVINRKALNILHRLNGDKVLIRHWNRVKKARGVEARTGTVLYSDEVDTRYHCVCVEQTPDFAPILFEDVVKRIEAEGGEVGFRNGNGPTVD